LRRSLFNLPNFGAPPEQKYHERKVFAYRPEQLYNVVSDVASYPCFIPFCTGSRILTLSNAAPLAVRTMQAELTVGFKSFTESYVSNVTCVPYESVTAVATASSSLFKSLTTTWRLQPIPAAHSGSLGSAKTLVSFHLEFAFSNPLHAAVSIAFFSQVSKMMIDAFERRCLEVYGSPEGE
ncbi:hypothetical protein FISHEDRAFT_26748, partial [Fistulina hepatica ATCC 64428]